MPAQSRNIGGKLLALAAVVLIAIPLILTVKDRFGGSPQACQGDAASIPGSAGIVYATQQQLVLNGSVCLAIRGEAYFERERADYEKARSDVDASTALLAEAQRETDAGKKQALIAVAQREVDNASRRLAAAATALQAGALSKTVYLFINDARTPVSTELYVSDPKATKAGWTWKSFPVTAPQDSESEPGKLWRQILSGTPLDGGRPVRLGLGDGDGKLPRSHAVMADDITLRIYELRDLVLVTLGVALLAIGLLLWSWDTQLLRDKSAKTPAPFSLARTQFAWWLFLVTGGFLYIWLVTGQFLGVVTPGVLTLLGISGVSGLAAVAIDPAPNANESKGFLTDILSDNGTIMLHRVQMFAWTVILGAILLWTVVTTFAFPKFDANLLVMAGIVNGLYLGFKFPEKKATA